MKALNYIVKWYFKHGIAEDRFLLFFYVFFTATQIIWQEYNSASSAT